ncbi:hypothetical protein FGO68_gene14591 [Halteria grandinella]|uniref:Uncharacterized protein n=1 Tax=Halteria grandinella TaxID=5974 RepID=A0A8J8P843_HALGN|nr:hypothetical protein FGO68_gene14591 [Halteria grandinella]
MEKMRRQWKILAQRMAIWCLSDLSKAVSFVQVGARVIVPNLLKQGFSQSLLQYFTSELTDHHPALHFHKILIFF